MEGGSPANHEGFANKPDHPQNVHEDSVEKEVVRRMHLMHVRRKGSPKAGSSASSDVTELQRGLSGLTDSASPKVELATQEELLLVRSERDEHLRVMQAQQAEQAQLRQAQLAAEAQMCEQLEAERLSLLSEMEHVEITSEHRAREELQTVQIELCRRSAEELRALSLELERRSTAELENRVSAKYRHEHAELRHSLEAEHRARNMEMLISSEEVVQRQATAEALMVSEMHAHAARLDSARQHKTNLEMQVQVLQSEMQEATRQALTQQQELQLLRQALPSSQKHQQRKESTPASSSSAGAASSSSPSGNLRQKLAQATFSRERPLVSVLRVLEDEFQSPTAQTPISPPDQQNSGNAGSAEDGFMGSWLACCSKVEQAKTVPVQLPP